MPSAVITTKTSELLEAVLPYRVESIDDDDDQIEAALGLRGLEGRGGGGGNDSSSTGSGSGSQTSHDDVGHGHGPARLARLRRCVI
jgi:hypothetical protein